MPLVTYVSVKPIQLTPVDLQHGCVYYCSVLPTAKSLDLWPYSSWDGCQHCESVQGDYPGGFMLDKLKKELVSII